MGRTIKDPKVYEDRNAYRGLVLADRLNELKLTDEHGYLARLGRALAVEPSAIGHWIGGRVGMSYGNEAGVAYLLGLDRRDLHPEDDDKAFHPYLSETRHSRAVAVFVETYARINRNKDFTELFEACTGRKQGSEEDFNWLVDNGFPVRWLETRLKEDHGIDLLRWKTPVLKEAEPYTPGPRQAVPETPEILNVPSLPHVPDPAHADANRVKLLLRNLESFRTSLGLQWFIRDDGSLGAKRVMVEEF